MGDSNGQSLKPGTPGIDYKGHLVHLEIGQNLHRAVLLFALAVLVLVVLLRCGS